MTPCILSTSGYSITSKPWYYTKKNATRPLKHRDKNIEPQRRKDRKGTQKIYYSSFCDLRALATAASARKRLLHYSLSGLWG